MGFLQFLRVLGPAALVLSSLVDAAHLPVTGRSVVGTAQSARRKVSRRSNMSGLTNSNDVVYMMNITLGGAPYDVMIDTGR
jgi:hypothetical protein